jgi:hypothetical protein
MKKADVGGPDSIQCGKRLPVRVGMRGAHRVVQVFRLHANSKLLEVIARELIVLTVKQLFLNGPRPRRASGCSSTFVEIRLRQYVACVDGQTC